MIVRFTFILNGLQWSWDKVFHGDMNEQRIKDYLAVKNLPLDLTDLKYKIL